MTTFINLSNVNFVLLSNENVNYNPETQVYTANPEYIIVLRTIPKNGKLARVSMINTPSSPIDGIPVEEVQYGEIKGLPEPTGDTYYIVSGVVAAAAKQQGRTDVLAPGILVRNVNNPSETLGTLFLQR